MLISAIVVPRNFFQFVDHLDSLEDNLPLKKEIYTFFGEKTNICQNMKQLEFIEINKYSEVLIVIILIYQPYVSDY
jgi:hypothetical protein